MAKIKRMIVGVVLLIIGIVLIQETQIIPILNGGWEGQLIVMGLQSKRGIEYELVMIFGIAGLISVLCGVILFIQGILSFSNQIKGAATVASSVANQAITQAASYQNSNAPGSAPSIKRSLFCPNCGTKLLDDGQYCPGCGGHIE